MCPQQCLIQRSVGLLIEKCISFEFLFYKNNLLITSKICNYVMYFGATNLRHLKMYFSLESSHFEILIPNNTISYTECIVCSLKIFNNSSEIICVIIVLHLLYTIICLDNRMNEVDNLKIHRVLLKRNLIALKCLRINFYITHVSLHWTFIRCTLNLKLIISKEIFSFKLILVSVRDISAWIPRITYSCWLKILLYFCLSVGTIFHSSIGSIT